MTNHCNECHYYSVQEVRSGDRILPEPICSYYPSNFHCSPMRIKENLCGREGRFYDKRTS